MGVEAIEGDEQPLINKSIFYLLVDRSGTMKHDIDTVNEILSNIVEDLSFETAVKLSVQLGVVSFADTARLDIAARDIESAMPVPKVRSGGRTNFEAAFKLLASDIERVQRDNAARNIQSHRTVVFLLTDGRPEPSTQKWQDALEALLDTSTTRPHIFAFGLGSMDRTILGEMATDQAWIFPGATREQVRESLREWANVFVGTVVGTASSGELRLEPPQGAEQLPVIPLAARSAG